MIRVLFADDEAMVCAGIRAILAAAGDIEVAAEAGDGREALELDIDAGVVPAGSPSTPPRASFAG